jgi:YqaJ-like viral recombinase domain
VGFIDHPTVLRSGASPDGLVGERGMVEIKCPNTATHCEWALAGRVPPEHELQMQWQMDCCDRDWCDFVSYDPRMPDGQQLFVRRTNRLGYDAMMDLRKAVSDFDSEVELMIGDLQHVKWF